MAKFSREDLMGIEGMTEAMVGQVMDLHQATETAHRQAMDALRGENDTLRASTPSAEVMTELDQLRKWKTDREEADRKAAEDAQWRGRLEKQREEQIGRDWFTEFNQNGVLEEFKTEVGKNSGESDAEIFSRITKGREDALFVPKRQAFVNPAAQVTSTEPASVEDYMRSNPKYKNNSWVNKN